MKIPFQQWLEQQNLDKKSVALFQESVLCYRATAYQASLMFSYLGLLRILAIRILSANCPPGFPRSKWNKLQADVQSDEVWEGTTFEATQRKQPAPIFLGSEDTRLQLQYWRARRNDAAHARGQPVDAALVETLWVFAKSVYGKLVVIGGRESLSARFRSHFDIDETPAGRPFDTLVSHIQDWVPRDELPGFFLEMLCLVANYPRGTSLSCSNPRLRAERRD